MSRERLLLDTAFVEALINQRDQYHQRALAFLPRVEAAAEVWITEAVLVEVGNALSAVNREAAVEFIQQCYSVENIHVVPVDTALLDRALALYEARADKTWGLTDCISFIVMENLGLTDAVTADRHFIQAGYRAARSLANCDLISIPRQKPGFCEKPGFLIFLGAIALDKNPPPPLY